MDPEKLAELIYNTLVDEYKLIYTGQSFKPWVYLAKVDQTPRIQAAKNVINELIIRGVIK